MKKIIKSLFLAAIITASNQSYAIFGIGDTTFDESNFTQNLIQVAQQAKQLGVDTENLEKTIQMLQYAISTYEAITGVTQGGFTLGQLQQLRQYLPADWQQILNAGYGNYRQIMAANVLTPLSSFPIAQDGEVAETFTKERKDSAVYKAVLDKQWETIDANFGALEQGLKGFDNCETLKCTMDLTGRSVIAVASTVNETNHILAAHFHHESEKERAALRNKERIQKPYKMDFFGLTKQVANRVIGSDGTVVEEGGGDGGF